MNSRRPAESTRTGYLFCIDTGADTPWRRLLVDPFQSRPSVPGFNTAWITRKQYYNTLLKVHILHQRGDFSPSTGIPTFDGILNTPFAACAVPATPYDITPCRHPHTIALHQDWNQYNTKKSGFLVLVFWNRLLVRFYSSVFFSGIYFWS